MTTLATKPVGQLGLGPREEDAHLPEKLQYTKSMANKVFADLSFGGQHGACVMVEAAANGHRGATIYRRDRNRDETEQARGRVERFDDASSR